MRALALAALLCGFATQHAAWAQSKRYPPVAPDKDLQDETHSGLWSNTLHPDNGPYAELVRDAKRLIDHGDPADTQTGLDKLADAIKRLPKQSDAYMVRGQHYLSSHQWDKCADDLAAAEASSKVDDLTQRTRSRIDLGVCQARAGHYADAEQTLIRAGASAPAYKGELLMRLGETRIELGKLDEAIDALLAALDQTDSSNEMTRWLLALAYDRARKPTDAAQYAADANRYDQSQSMINSPRLPLLGADDRDYLLGVSYLYAPPRLEAPLPEYALLYFRLYLANAGDSPWRRRAEEHIKDLTAMKFPSRSAITLMTPPGVTSVTADKLRDPLEKSMFQLRQCVASVPDLAFQVTVTRDGPKTPETVRDRPIYRVPAEGVNAGKLVDLTNSNAGLVTDTQHTAECLEKLVSRIGFPRPKERDSYYRLSFIVVAP